MSKDVTIVLEAQDKASVVLEQVAKSVENNVKQIKGVGETTKKSTELVGQLANALGQTGLGSYAGQFAALTEKISAFSEVMKKGTGGTLAFKAGLVGLVGVIAFQIGNALGNIIFQTEEWTKALEEANAKAKELSQANLSSLGRQFDSAKADIELIRDPESKQKAYQDLFDQLNANVAGTENQVRRQAAVVAEWEAAWFKFGERAASADMDAAQLEADRERLKLLTQQRDELQRMMTVEKEREEIRQTNKEIERGNQYIANLKSEIELLSTKKENLNELTAANNTYNLSQAQLAQQLLDQRDALKLEQEQAAAVEKTIAELERKLAVEQQGEEQVKNQEQLALATNDAERERIALLQAQIAAQQQQNEAVEQLKKTEEEAAKEREKQQEDLIKEQERQRQALANVPTSITGTQSRLLTRGPADRGIDKVAKNTEKTVAKLEEVKTTLETFRPTFTTPGIKVIG